MISTNKIRGVILSALLVFTSCCLAQKQFQHLTSSDGISQSEVYSFLEDAHGFMWFGTVDGLNRYDGYAITTFNTNKDSPNSITNNTIRCLVEDELGRIWIGTDDGLCVYDSKMEKIHQVRLSGFEESRLTVNTALIGDERLYVGTSLGFLSMDIRPNSLEKIANGVALVKIEADNPDYHVVAGTSGKDGSIWFTTETNLYHLPVGGSNRSSSPTMTLNLKETLPGIRNLEVDSFGNLWIVSHDNGFLRYNPKTKQSKHFKKSPLNRSISSNKISSVKVDKLGDLWIGTHDRGLLFLEKENLNDELPNFQAIEHDPYNDRSLSSNLIYSLFVSKNNLLWIGTIGAGVSIYDPYRKPFQYYNLHSATNQSSYSSNFIRAVFADQEDKIWIGTHNNGLFLLNRKGGEKINKVGFGTESIFHLNDAGNGNVFVCTGQGISLVKKSNDRVSLINSLAVGPTFYATTVKNDIFWVASLNGLIKCRLTERGIVQEEVYNKGSNPAISFNNCRVLYFDDKSNQLFIGTEGGGLTILQLDKGGIPIGTIIYKKGAIPTTLSNNYIRSITASSDSVIWIGTYEGLNKMYWDNSGKIKFKAYTIKNGLSNNTIQSIVEDDQQKLWIGTNQGLCKFDPETEVFIQYTINDGLQSNEFSEHTVFKKADNEIIIGGINGFNTFYPDQIVSSGNKTNTTLTDFYLFNKKIGIDQVTIEGKNSPLKKSISLTDSIFLNPNQNSIGFDFSAMIYNAPEKVQYAYLLKGFDKEWMLTDASNRKANYTNLSYGDYIFKVKSTNNDGLWEQTPKSVFISIKTPFYLTNLAFISYALLALLTFLFFTNYSILRYTTKNKILLENQHNKKIRELEELRTRFFINVSHDLRTPLTLISSPLEIVLKNTSLQSEVKDLLDLVQRNVKKLRDMTEQLLDLSKVEEGNLTPKLQNSDMVAFVKNEGLFFESAFKNKGIDFIITSEESPFVLSFDPDMISKVLFNMLSNALKHTHKGKVAIHLLKVPSQSLKKEYATPYDQYLKIAIEDSGDGINPTDLAMIFERFYQAKEQNKKGYGIGLSHSKDLVQVHEGYIDVESVKGRGTTFKIYLPFVQKEGVAKTIIPVATQERSQLFTTEDKEDTKPTNKLTLLLVEDNLDLRVFMRNELRKIYTVLEAEDGEKGLEMAKTHFPDFIISDVMMPNMDGMEFCKQLKSNIKTSHIPVILLTAKVDKETKYKGLEIGADDYISKPFEMEYLQLRISNLIKNRERLRRMFEGNFKLEPSKVTVTSIDEEFLTNLMIQMEEGIPNADFSINTLERTLGMSHSSFYKKLTSLTGQSAKELLLSMRMKRAKQILEDTSNVRVSEVAYMVGFTDPKYFSKRFKAFFGASPTSFVKK